MKKITLKLFAPLSVVALLSGNVFAQQSTSVTSRNASLNKQALEFFGVTAKDIKILSSTKSLNLNDGRQYEVYQAVGAALSYYQVGVGNVTRDDLTAEEFQLFSLAQGLVHMVPCQIAIDGVHSWDLATNMGLSTANVGFSEFQEMASKIYDAVGDNEIADNLILALADRESSSTTSLRTCDIVNLDPSKCCEDNASGVGQHCKASTATTDKCGTFLRNGTSVCRITSTSC